MRRPVDTGEVGLGGVQEYLRSIDAPREVAVGCSLPFCFEHAGAGRFCREHQPLMEAR